jgi:hypothetical protein
MIEAICSSDMSVLVRTTRRNIPEDSILLNLIGHPNADAPRLL